MTSSRISSQQSIQSSNVSTSQPINGEAADLNILLLGETGVGKSTFINSFANHLTYNTLDEALKRNTVAVIPVAFSFTDSDTFEERLIQIGTPDKNENNVGYGESKTQGCKSYVFSLGNRTLRLIDAPGIGDTRGLEQDANSFEHILAYISQYERLDGICILISNESRMDILFRFCIKELLSHLHVSVKDNIMFVFTFSERSFYRPGYAAPILKRLLEEFRDRTGVDVPFSGDNTFIIENESLRFLALKNCGVEFFNDHLQVFSKMWDISAKEYGNLVKRIVRCTPYFVRDTVSLNEAQQLIRKLHRPIAEVLRLVEENIQLAEKYKLQQPNDAAKTTTTNNPPDNHISVPQFSAKVIKLHYPRTVCTTESCIRVIDIEGTQTVDYNSHCHEHCYLKAVEQEVINNPALKQCAAMNQLLETCNNCNCSWTTHKHITYEYRTYLTSINIPLNISDAADNVQVSSSTIEDAINKYLENMNGEVTTIISVYIKLARFLWVNSILPCKGDTADYIKHFITEEQLKQKTNGQNDDVIRGLQASLKAYEDDMQLFNMAVKADHDLAARIGNDTLTTESLRIIKEVPTTEKIFPLVESLYKLPINGDKIRQQVESLKDIQITNVTHREQVIQLPSSITTSVLVNRLKQALN